jgi:osmotically-inducible protein OsmY
MRTHLSLIAAVVILPALLLSQLAAQEGTAEKLGRRIDQGIENLSQEVQEAWSEARARLDKLTVQGRVYGRLRWDKTLADEPIDVSVEANDLVTLSGRVPNEEARQKALTLTKDTVGVREVIDRLQVDPLRRINRPADK